MKLLSYPSLQIEKAHSDAKRCISRERFTKLRGTNHCWKLAHQQKLIARGHSFSVVYTRERWLVCDVGCY